MPERNVLVNQQDSVAIVTINRPEKLNALNNQTVLELDAAMSGLASEDGVRAVVIRGSGEKAFVAGADISEIAGLSADAAKKFALQGQGVFRRIEKMTKPVIAAVNGFALGGGCELAMACHIRIASERARFGQPEVNLGIIPGYGGTQRLPRLIGLSNALHLLLTGEMISASRAFELGLVSEVLPADELMERAVSLANQLSAKAPLALGYILEASYHGLNGSIDEGLAVEAGLFRKSCETVDMKIGTTAFLNKESPKFIGK